LICLKAIAGFALDVLARSVARVLGLTMKKFTITIIANSMETYRSQLLEIESAADEVEIGDDRAERRRRQQIKVFWTGGKADALNDANNVKLLDENRGFTFDGELSSRSRPRDTPEGVEFFLVRDA
jgi:hypothetical protein